MLSIELYNKNRTPQQQSLILKKKKYYEDSLRKREFSLKQKIAKSIKKNTDLMLIKLERDINRQIQDKQKKLNKAIREIMEKKPKKVKPKIGSVKNKAFAIFQKYTKLYWADDDGYVTLADNGERVKLGSKIINAGHYYPKQNFPQLAFEVNNVLPISRGTNKLQGDNVGLRWEEGFVGYIGLDEYNRLETIANDKLLKNQAKQKLCAGFYREKYQEYKEKYDTLYEKKFGGATNTIQTKE